VRYARSRSWLPVAARLRPEAAAAPGPRGVDRTVAGEGGRGMIYGVDRYPGYNCPASKRHLETPGFESQPP